MAEQTAAAENEYRKEKKQMDPRVALVLMLIMLCVALCHGANKAWKRNRQGVEAAYSAWQENIEQRVETAYNLLTVAGRYLSGDNTLVAAVKTDLTAMESLAQSSTSMQTASAASDRFVSDANALLNNLSANGAVITDSRDSMYVNAMLPQAVEQCGKDTAKAAYNAAAESFNDGMHSFSGLLARWTGVGYATVLESTSQTADAGQ